jgi:hypothetical protein
MERAAMIRLTWRQFRTQAAVVAGLLAVIAIALSITGPQLVHLYDTAVVPCQARDDCSLAISAFLSHDSLLQDLGTVLVVVPGIIGVFWGAPLMARELETGTYKLTWMQSVTRRRWLAVKLSLIGMSSIAVAGLLSLMVTWWSSPLDRVNADPFPLFDERGIVPLGYAAFAFALGVTAGLLLRRTVPAMVATLVVFAGIRLAVTNWVRPYLFAPLRITAALPLLPAGNGPTDLAAGNGPTDLAAELKPTDWIVSDQTVNAAGQVIGQNGAIDYGGGRYGILFRPLGNGRMTLQGVGLCPNRFPVSANAARAGQPSPAFQQAAQECIARLRVTEIVTYQPTSRYWPLQWYELAIFVCLALLLAGFCFYWLRRRFA